MTLIFPMELSPNFLGPNFFRRSDLCWKQSISVRNKDASNTLMLYCVYIAQLSSAHALKVYWIQKEKLKFRNFTMAAVQQLCLHYKTGFCKYREQCKNKHVEELCEVSSCTGDNCSKRHPKTCKFYLSLGQCRFSDSCKYSHDNQLCKDVSSFRQEILDVRSRLI